MFFTQAGIPDNWSVDLYVQWDTPISSNTNGDVGLTANNSNDQLSVIPSITLSTNGVESLPLQPVPLPPAGWVVGELFSLWSAAWCVQKASGKIRAAIRP
jgi:hypothetical protein